LDPCWSYAICTLYTLGHGREPRVFWGIEDARGRRLAQQRDVTRP
jgi:hypothetical protein